MTRQTKINKTVMMFSNNISVESEYYTQDIQNFRNKLSLLSDKEVDRVYKNHCFLNSSIFSKIVDREVSKMDKAGMFK